MSWGQGAKRPILGLLFRAQQQSCRGHRYSSSTFQAHQLGTHVPQDGVFLRRFSSEVPASEQMNLIRQLRQRTSAPIKDAAHKDLRKRGVALAAKKSSRTAAEGLLAIAQDEKRAAVASSLAKMVLSAQGPGELFLPFGPEYMENMSINLDHPKLNGETTVQSAVTEVAAMVGENVKLRRGFMLSTTGHGVVSSYMHTCPPPGLGRIAGLVTLEAEDSSLLDALKRVGSSIVMHIAKSSGKSQMAMDKMVEGRLRKYFEEVVLMEQKYILNDSINIKEVGSKVTIGKFIRMRYNIIVPHVISADKCFFFLD
uniref:Elongation factor Ts, mitochondrial n=1 Tax=Setaria viridis TaxID=4556 RepID=A0A4U6UX91_SETVI|nr:hypothetical protein SEVIR_5G210000v2 [Setaria viridis]